MISKNGLYVYKIDYSVYMDLYEILSLNIMLVKLIKYVYLLF